MRSHDADYTAFVEVRGTALLRTARLLSSQPSQAEDLLQTALTKTYLAWPRLRDPGAAEAYTRRVLVTSTISWWRRRFNRMEHATDVVPDLGVAARDDEVAERDELMAALRRLSPQQRAVLVLRYYEDQSELEIASCLGIATGSVKAHASRGLARLRQILGEDADLADVSTEEQR